MADFKGSKSKRKERAVRENRGLTCIRTIPTRLSPRPALHFLLQGITLRVYDMQSRTCIFTFCVAGRGIEDEVFVYEMERVARVFYLSAFYTGI